MVYWADTKYKTLVYTTGNNILSLFQDTISDIIFHRCQVVCLLLLHLEKLFACPAAKWGIRSKRRGRGRSIFYPHPPKVDRNPNPQIFVSALWKMKSEGLIICGPLWKKFLNGRNFVSFFEVKIPNPPLQKPAILGVGGGGADKKWNVPSRIWRQEISVSLPSSCSTKDASFHIILINIHHSGSHAFLQKTAILKGNDNLCSVLVS